MYYIVTTAHGLQFPGRVFCIVLAKNLGYNGSHEIFDIYRYSQDVIWNYKVERNQATDTTKLEKP